MYKTGTREMPQWLRECTALTEDQFGFPVPTRGDPQSLITPGPEDPCVPRGSCTHVHIFTHIHATKQKAKSLKIQDKNNRTYVHSHRLALFNPYINAQALSKS